MKISNQNAGEERDRKNIIKFYSSVSSNMEKAIKESGLNQRQISEKCNQLGFTITQSTISQITTYHSYGYRSQSNRVPYYMSIMNLIYICKALNTDFSKILESQDPELVGFLPKSGDSEKGRKGYTIISNPDYNAFFGYDGNYHCYFHPTISHENQLLHATMTIEHDYISELCKVEFCIMVNQREEEKTYLGYMYISIPQHSCYCILSNSLNGEICMICFHHQFFTNYKLQCRLATAITTSAGDNKRPTVHRILISREPLEPEVLETAKSSILMNNSQIDIPLRNLDDLKKEIPPAFYDKLTNSIAPQEHYLINESKITELFGDIDDKVRAELICKIRKHSSSPKYNKIGTKADEILYKYLSGIADKRGAVPNNSEDEIE